MISRSYHLAQVLGLLRTSPVVALLGARQVGKSTLAREISRRWRRGSTYFDLELPADLRRLAEPTRTLGRLSGLVILDEIQRAPDLFPVLRVLADRPGGPRFLVLGSAAPGLLRQSSETLAGRIAFYVLPTLSLAEVKSSRLERLWLRGGFPSSFTASSDARSARWRRDFAHTFLARDVPGFGITIPEPTLRRFWTMLAHLHGATLNWSELGRSMGVADNTVRGYLDALTSTYVVRQLQPFFENISKRQVKSPKVYIADSGLLHTLLDLETMDELEAHPRVGFSWEGFCMDQVIHRLGARADQCFFWATHAGAELDLLVVAGNLRLGFEMKLTDAPAVTPSMRSALTDLGLTQLTVIHSGRESYELSERIRAVALSRLSLDLLPLARARRVSTRA